MVVDIVPPNEAPRLSGTPSNLKSSGSDTPGRFSSTSTVGQPPPKPPAPSPQQPQQRSELQTDAKAQRAKSKPEQTKPEQAKQTKTAEAKTAQRGMALPEAAQGETARPEMTPIEMPEAPPAPPQPQAQDTPDQPETAEQFAQQALLGGRLGGGFEAPPVDTVRPGVDFTTAFRERVSSCSSLPAGVASTDKVTVSMRIFLNPDGTLASAQPLEPIESTRQRALMESSIDALRKCQPYTMLPPDKYNQWKRLDLTFYPMNYFGN